MNDNLKTNIVTAIFVGIVCTLAGGKAENTRILTKCLEYNGTMPYAEAVEQCKEMVK